LQSVRATPPGVSRHAPAAALLAILSAAEASDHA